MSCADMNETINGTKNNNRKKKGVFFFLNLSFIENKRQNICQIGRVGD